MVLLETRASNGGFYMRFANAAKQENFLSADTKIKHRQFCAIKRAYPNLSDEVIRGIVANQDVLLADDIYYLIRFYEKGYELPYMEFKDAVDYAEKPTKDIKVFEYQRWTWSRASVIERQHFIKDIHHMSLNVNVVEGLVKALDKVVVEDAGRYIDYYKIPKAGYYKEATTRHDPVTVYLYNRNREVEQNIVKAVAPYARSNEGLLGQVLGKGVDINEETSCKYGMSVGRMASKKIYDMLANTRASR